MDVGPAESSEPTGRGRGRPRDAGKRDAVLRAARTLFLARGLDAVSVDAIAAAAGVSKATLYRHFADKEALFDAVVAADIDQFRYPPSDIDFAGAAEFRAFLRQLGVTLIGFLSQPSDGDLGRLLMIEAKRHPRHAARFVERGPDAMHRWLSDLLARGTAAGYVRTPDPAVASDHLLSMWLGMHHVRERFGAAPPRGADEIAAHVGGCVDAFFRAYAPRR